jgi:beta-glucosidase
MTTTAWHDAVQRIREGSAPEEQADALLDQLDRDEQLWLLDGDVEFWAGLLSMLQKGYNLEPIVAGEIPRLGIPGLRFADGPRGAVVGSSTCFPVPMARGATWDAELERRIGVAIGREVAAQGGNLFGGVCINLLRHPAWGRAQETYGEDPWHVGTLGEALALGVQEHVMACLKHFALNSMENARFSVDVQVSEAALHETYLPHFRRVVEAGVACVMSAYNAVNGEWCGQSPELLTRILREELGFDGIVVSDFIFGLRDAAASVRAGLDVEMPVRQQRAQALPAALDSGALDEQDVQRAAHRVLRTALRFAAVLPPPPGVDVVASPPHVALAREAAARSFVLLRNAEVDGSPALPLDPTALRRVAVVGRLADLPNTGDHGSSDVRAPYVVTPLHGLREALPGVDVQHAAEFEEAVALAARADAVLVCVGYTAKDEGEYVGEMTSELLALFPPAEDDSVLIQVAEALQDGAMGTGGDRDLLTLHPGDVDLIAAVAAVQPRTVVSLTAASAVLVRDWIDLPSATLVTWYAGMEGGGALADVLLGAAEPTGRLPFSVPRSEQDLPAFDRHATVASYDGLHGQRLLDERGVQAEFPLGYGLGYTSFGLSEATADVQETGIAVAATVTNLGARDGRHVVQVYARPEDGSRPRALVGFLPVAVAAGQAARLSIGCDLRPLTRRRNCSWLPPDGTWLLEICSYSGDPDAVVLPIALGGSPHPYPPACPHA